MDALVDIDIEGQTVIPVLCQLLRDENAEDALKHDAIHALAKLGPNGKPAIPILVKMISEEPVWSSDKNAVRACRAIGPDAAEALATVLEKADGNMAVRLVHVLGQMGSVAKVALPVIRNKKGDEQFQREAMWAIAQIK